MSIHQPIPLRLTETEAQRLKIKAYCRYANFPHADPRVGRERYRAEIDAINALTEGEV